VTIFSNPSESRIRSILSDSKTIAVVGISDRERRDSKYVSEYMRNAGYTIYPVNPNLDVWNGLKVFDSILDIPAEIDIVDVFRPPEFVMPVAEDAVKVGARVFWLQQGIINYEAAELVLTAGTTVVMDSCIMVEHQSMKLSS